MNIDNGIKVILERAFPDALSILKLNGDTHISFIPEQTLTKQWYRSSMCTISCGYFRMLIMLHFPIRHRYSESYTHLYQEPEILNDHKKYLDQMNEVSNKLCGTSCNILEDNNFSTGMTRPNLLTVYRATDYVDSLNVVGRSHICSYINDTPFLMASLFVVSNRGEEEHITIDINTEHLGDIVNSGELEIFEQGEV